MSLTSPNPSTTSSAPTAKRPIRTSAAASCSANPDGDDLRVAQLIRAGNTRTDSAHNRYNIAPQELIAAQREGRKQGLDIVGFYHSHPDHPAQWPSTDFAEAHWFGCAYVITSTDGDKTTGHAKITNSFLLTGTGEEDKAFTVQLIEVT